MGQMGKLRGRREFVFFGSLEWGNSTHTKKKKTEGEGGRRTGKWKFGGKECGTDLGKG